MFRQLLGYQVPLTLDITRLNEGSSVILKLHKYRVIKLL